MDPYMQELTHFCLPQLMPLLRSTARYVHETFEFYEELLGARYPYSYFKTVFVDEAYKYKTSSQPPVGRYMGSLFSFVLVVLRGRDVSSFSTLSIMSVDLLQSTPYLEQTYATREAISLAVGEQFFTCFLSRQGWNDAWLTQGISSYLAGLHSKKLFGNNEYRHWVHQVTAARLTFSSWLPFPCVGQVQSRTEDNGDRGPLQELDEVVRYEEEVGGIILDASKPPGNTVPTSGGGQQPIRSPDSFHFWPHSAHTVTPRHARVMRKKAHLVLRMLELRIGQQLLIQVTRPVLVAPTWLTRSRRETRSYPSDGSLTAKK